MDKAVEGKWITLEEDLDSSKTLRTDSKKVYPTLDELVISLGWNQDGNKRYVDSGNWTEGYEDQFGNHHYSVDRGCACMHDCCGHVCTERYEIIESEYHWVIIETIGLNY